ncbi:MAG: cupin protein [Enterovirga sp.]|nr:cupin protein [Enterovirga sp.]
MNTSVPVRPPNLKVQHSVDVLLGERIRERRRVQGMSLKDVADLSGISIGLLSQIERGLSSPSLRVLASLADALNVGLGNLFDENLSAEPTETRIVVREDERKKLGFWRTGIFKELLTPQTGRSGLEIFMITIEPGGTTGSQVYAHDGEEGGLVLEGDISIEVEGVAHRLRKGDSFRFDSTRPHSFHNVGKKEARVVWVNAHPPKAD